MSTDGRPPQYWEAVRLNAKVGVLRAIARGRGEPMEPALTLPELKLLALYSREEERKEGTRVPFTVAMKELNKLAGIVFGQEAPSSPN